MLRMSSSICAGYLAIALLTECPNVAIGAKFLSNFEEYAFRRDVVRRAEERARTVKEVRQLEGIRLNSLSSFTAPNLDEILLEKAIPVEEYEARLLATGGPRLLKTSEHSKQLDDVPDFMRAKTQKNAEPWQRHLEDKQNDNDDDYIMDDDEMYDFAGYSLKYATCQKIARFSSNAVLNGEYSALVTDDIVFLRLCPKRRCSSDKQWGCTNGYGEYALELRDYLNIMLHYQVQKQEALCNFCAACVDGSFYNNQGNNGDENYGDDDDGRKRGLEDGRNDEAVYADDFYDADADVQNVADDDGSGGNSYGEYGIDPCETYADLCSDLEDEGSCSYGDDDDDDDDDLDYLEYINYFDCVEVDGMEGGSFWVSPRCDPQSTKIQMGIFYDPYCSQYAGNEYNLNEFSGVNFNNDVFEDFYSGECISCAKSYDPPYYNVQSNLCNKVYMKSGQCNTYFAMSLNDDDDAYDKSSYSEAVCSFIDSVRFGSFDSNGEIIASGSQYGSEVRGEVTYGQTLGLIFTCLICGSLAVYSCYLHHSITNVLLRSLSQAPLVSSDRSARSRKSRSRGNSKSRGNSRSRGNSKSRRDDRERDDKSDWDYQIS